MKYLKDTTYDVGSKTLDEIYELFPETRKVIDKLREIERNP